MLTQQRLKELLDYDPATGIFTWKVRRGRIPAGSVAGCKNVDGYIQIYVDRKNYYGHVLAWLYVYGAAVRLLDHKDTDKSNNRITNLRPATSSCNGGNARRSRANTSGYKGVTYDRDRGKWLAQIKVRRKHIYLGRFDCPIQAHLAYVDAARKYFGQFARAA